MVKTKSIWKCELEVKIKKKIWPLIGAVQLNPMRLYVFSLLFLGSEVAHNPKLCVDTENSVDLFF